MRQQLQKFLGKGYMTADLLEPDVMEKMDLTNIPHANSSFDIIYCSHVFEHIVDDKKAMGEVYRVLRKDGWAILLVPITSEKTIESQAFTEDPEERLRLFGQEDHWRRYGPDYINRLRDAGFRVEALEANDFLDFGEMKRLRVDTKAAGKIIYCTR
jgi:SAM-dependent methyltransferase